MKSVFVVCCLLLSTLVYSQRVVVPNQELLYPFLNDPSFIGEGQRIQLTGLLQLSNSDREQTTKWLNAQVALYDNIAFGLDYYNDSFDFYDYSTIMFSTAFKIGMGGYNHHIKIGLSGGGESRKQDSRPLSVVPDNQDFVTDITGNNLKFIYKAGLHYTNKNFTLGGYYNSLPIQNITIENQNDILHYTIKEGYTAYVWYDFRVAEKFRITPVFRYLEYLEDAIYEGALKFNYSNKVEASVAYRSDYSINPAIRFRVIKALDVGYSYEKAIGVKDFKDVHGLSATYKFFKADEEEPEWLQNARDNIEEVERIKKKPELKDPPFTKAKEEEKKIREPEIKEGKVAEPKVELKKEVKPVEEELVREELAVEQKKEVKTEKTVSKKVSPKKDVLKRAASEKTEPKAAEKIPLPEEKQEKLPESAIQILEKGFYIVVGSFEANEKAETYMLRIDKNFYFARKGKKESNGPIHVYIDSDSNKEVAIKKLRAHRLDKNFKNARLLEVE